MEFLVILNVALAVCILLVIALRRVVRQILGAGAVYGLWLLPLALMIGSLLPASETFVTLPAIEQGSVAPLIPDLRAPYERQIPDLVPIERSSSYLWDAALWIALIGAAASAVLMVYSQVRFERGISDGLGYERAGMTCLRGAGGLCGPALVGLIRPRLVLPGDFETRFTLPEQDMVLAHEQAHMKRRDPLVNGIIALMLCVFWYNPLVHLAARLIRLDQDMACDARVLRSGLADRRTYANALLKAQIGAMPPFVCAWPAITETALKSRIIALGQRQSDRMARAGGLVAVLTSLMLGSAAWAIKAPEVHYIYESVPSSFLLPAAAVYSTNIDDFSRPEIDSEGRVSGRSGQTSFVDEMIAAGLKDLDAEILIALRVHGVTADYLLKM